MNTRPGRLGIRQYSLILSLVIVLCIPFLLTFFFFQAYRTLALALMMLVVGSVGLFAGIKQAHLSKRNGASLPWWKHYLVIMALFEMSFGGLLLDVSPQILHLLNETLFNILGYFFLVLTLGFGIYALVLTVQYLATNTTSRHLF